MPTTIPATQANVPGLLNVQGLELRLPPKTDPETLEWGWRLCHPDLTSSHGYRWPFPGHWAKAPGPFTTSTDPCPTTPGDGICAARTWAGASSGGITSPTALVVAWAAGDVLANTPDKVRLRRAWVAEMTTSTRFVGPDANLRNANLRNADLRNANLRNADLRNANLRNADLRSADLCNADLRYADLCNADLRYADLCNADLRYADLCNADLRYADLCNANLRSANLGYANLRRARGNQHTAPPSGYRVNDSGLIVRGAR